MESLTEQARKTKEIFVLLRKVAHIFENSSPLCDKCDNEVSPSCKQLFKMCIVWELPSGKRLFINVHFLSTN